MQEIINKLILKFYESYEVYLLFFLAILAVLSGNFYFISAVLMYFALKFQINLVRFKEILTDLFMQREKMRLEINSTIKLKKLMETELKEIRELKNALLNLKVLVKEEE